jgi:hypothetical protein
MKIHSFLSCLAVLGALAVPASFAASAAGRPAPAAFDPLAVFAAFVVTVVLLGVSKEYGRHRIRFAGSTRAPVPAPAAPARAEHPLAA